MNTTSRPRRGFATLAVTLTLGAGVITSCGTASSTAAATTNTSNTSVVTPVSTAAFGSGCSQVPTDGAGSLTGMAAAAVATAAGANPLLSTLDTAIRKAGMVGTLNSADGITVFAPDDSAFAKLPAAQLGRLLDNRRLLRTVLRHHVVAGELTPGMLAGTHKTLAGDSIKVTGSSPDFRVSPGHARIVCGNVQTANATVYIVDTVLPPSN